MIRQAKCLAGSNPFIVVGDFNAAHSEWAYTYVTKRGKERSGIINEENLTLLTEPNTPTRIGRSTVMDTCPDLTLIAHAQNATWSNTGDNLGSDHMILETKIQGPQFRRIIGEAKITDWEALRTHRRGKPEEKINDISHWAKTLVEEIHAAYEETQALRSHPSGRPTLLHLQEARRSLLRRWKGQRHNKRLRIRIALLNKEAAEYAAQLCRQNWLQICDAVQGRLSTSKTWHILRYLIDPIPSILSRVRMYDMV